MENTLEQKTNPGFTYGLIAGLIVIVITLLQYLGGLDMYLSPIGNICYIVITTMAVLAALKSRKANDGALTFAEALKITFTVFALGLLLQTIFVYILFNYIDISFKQAVSQEMMNKTEQLMKKFGASDSQIDIERGKNPFAINKVVLGYAVTCIASFVICLLISAIVKKNKPVFNQL
jgi:hypothetical protein